MATERACWGMYGKRLRDLIEQDELLQCPGVHDSLTAAVADDVGFDAIYMTGYGTSLSKTGYPDAGLITMPEMVENAGNVQERSSVPSSRTPITGTATPSTSSAPSANT